MSENTTKTPAISLAAFMATEQQINERTITVQFKNIRFQIRHLSRSVIQAIAENSMEAGYTEGRNNRGGSRTRTINPEKFSKLIAERMIVGWENVTLNTLRDLVVLSLPEGVTKEQLDAPLPFSTAEVLSLMSTVPDLEQFLLECSGDASLFNDSPIREAVIPN